MTLVEASIERLLYDILQLLVKAYRKMDDVRQFSNKRLYCFFDLRYVMCGRAATFLRLADILICDVAVDVRED